MNASQVDPQSLQLLQEVLHEHYLLSLHVYSVPPVQVHGPKISQRSLYLVHSQYRQQKFSLCEYWFYRGAALDLWVQTGPTALETAVRSGLEMWVLRVLYKLVEVDEVSE